MLKKFVNLCFASIALSSPVLADSGITERFFVGTETIFPAVSGKINLETASGQLNQTLSQMDPTKDYTVLVLQDIASASFLSPLQVKPMQLQLVCDSRVVAEDSDSFLFKAGQHTARLFLRTELKGGSCSTLEIRYNGPKIPFAFQPLSLTIYENN